mmetsp:Transcript_22766/g.65485  ORF Transcript_22766/g.65485 Transcript_22766/m.65485 type:complete len:125 (+) Transcript_22766:183-557(+)
MALLEAAAGHWKPPAACSGGVGGPEARWEAPVSQHAAALRARTLEPSALTVSREMMGCDLCSAEAARRRAGCLISSVLAVERRSSLRALWGAMLRAALLGSYVALRSWRGLGACAACEPMRRLR